MIAHLDCSTGVSGDKFLGALLDAGTAAGTFDEDHLRAVADAIAPEARLEVMRTESHGIAALSIRVTAATTSEARHLSDITALLRSTDLSRPLIDRSLRVFGELAQAEARVHGTDPEEVHFHEVGAVDSIVDIVGVCAGLERLGVDRLIATPVAVGGGTVQTSHGALPVPAPATVALLSGVPIVPGPMTASGVVPGELTTPTGAALLKVVADGFGPCPPMTPRLVGYGSGTRDIGCPNVCRIVLGDHPETPDPLATQDVVLYETNLDHLSPEEAAFACEQLLAEGALDVWQTPVLMKKGRGAFVLSVLCTTAAAELTAERIVALTGTLGVRRTDLPRYVAGRERRVIDSPWGKVRVKVGPKGSEPKVRPEYEDVARIARETGRAFRELVDELTELALEALSDI